MAAFLSLAISTPTIVLANDDGNLPRFGSQLFATAPAPLNARNTVNYWVRGEVKTPGQVRGLRADTAIDIIARAGGIRSDSGSYRNIVLLREGQEVARFDLYDLMLGMTDRPPAVLPGDTIEVRRAGQLVETMRGGRRWRHEMPAENDVPPQTAEAAPSNSPQEPTALAAPPAAAEREDQAPAETPPPRSRALADASLFQTGEPTP